MKNALSLYLLLILVAPCLYGQQVLTIYPTEDAQLKYSTDPSRSYYSTNNYGSLSNIQSGQPEESMSYTTKLKALIGIDISTLPEGAQIIGATLFLYGDGNHETLVTTGFDYNYTDNTSYLQRVTSEWDESTVTWNSAPDIVTDNRVTLASSNTSSQNYTVNVKGLIEDIQANPDSSFGLMLIQKYDAGYCRMSFASSDHTDTTKHSKLEIVYTSDLTDNEGFEQSNTKWENVSGDNADWSRDSNGTTSSNTGPSDATEGQYYCYVEASTPNYPSKTAILQSPEYSFYKLDHPFIGFDYHMYGASMGTLYLEISTDLGETWDDPIWSKSGDQGDQWYSENIDLNDYFNEVVTLRFRGVTGSDWTSDMALDDITVYASTKVNPTEEENYIYTITPLSEHGLDRKIGQQIQYIDGLGRAKQDISIANNPSGYDMVKPIEYDELGRIIRNYLPYPETEDFFGSYRSYSLDDQNSFYLNQFDLSGEEAYAYSRAVFEESSLNRVLAQGSPGLSFNPIEETGEAVDHVRTTAIGTNDENEVRYFSFSFFDMLQSTGYYNANTLYTTSSKDEDGHMTQEFTDMSGKNILKRSFDGNDTLSTYYVYNDLGLLRYVLPPKAEADHGLPSSTVLQQTCYIYEYDDKNRMTSKKIPGVYAVEMVYDERDRLVGTGDGNRRDRKQWIFTKYDILNRPVLIVKRTFSSDLHQWQVADSIEYFYNNSAPTYYEEFSTSNSYGYTNQSFPQLGQNDTILQIAFYDSYDFRNLTGFGGLVFDGTNGVDSYQDLDGTSNGYFDNIVGQVTGSAQKILDGTDSNWIRSANYYDEKYRLLQTQTAMYPTGTSMASTDYDFTGNALQTLEMQSVNGITNKVLYQYTYDHSNRLRETYMKYNSEDEILLSRNRYDEIGQLAEKDLHSENEISFVQSIDYKYNTRGWLRNINQLYSLDGDNDLFVSELFYNEVGLHYDTTEYYNGNIRGVKWNHEDGTLDTIGVYIFDYDNLNRLKEADYQWYTSIAVLNNTNQFETGYTYDLNGNIQTLSRKDASGITMDSLTYVYGGNQLLYVSDDATNDGYYSNNSGDTAFYYDHNGNMTQDLNKDILVSYNELNLPKIIAEDATPSDTISYIYDASGVKWLKVADISGSKIETMYAGSFIYEDTSDNSTLNFNIDYVINPEGIISLSTSTPEYQYHLKDHRGNVRTVFTSDGTVLQETDYYPFGMTASLYSSGSDNKYLFNNKELQDEQLGGVNLDWYSYGARFYDPALGRWHVPDPLAESYYSHSPYHFTGNDPINLIDANGMSYSPYYDAGGKFLGVDEKGFSGEIYITDQNTFDKYKNDKGIVQSKEIQADKSTQSLRTTPTLSLEAQSSIYTNVLNQMSDIDFSGLYNSKVSINTRSSLNGERITYNNADSYDRFGYNTAENGQHRVTAFTNEYKSTLHTVESIQNWLGVHEYNGHGNHEFSGGKKLGGTHWKAYHLQAKHPTYKLLPVSQQNEISERFWEYLEVENPARYNYIINKHQSK